MALDEARLRFSCFRKPCRPSSNPKPAAGPSAILAHSLTAAAAAPGFLGERVTEGAGLPAAAQLSRSEGPALQASASPALTQGRLGAPWLPRDVVLT